MERLAPRWKLFLALTVLGGIAINVVGPNHVDLQNAGDADAFRDLVEPAGRHIASAVIDVGFSVVYALLAVAALAALRAPRAAALAGSGLVVAGAAFDEIENVLLLSNVVRSEQVTDGWIRAMQVPGTLKYLFVPGFLVVLGTLVWRALHRSPAAGSASH